MHQEMKCVCKRCKSRTRIMCLQGKSVSLARFPGAMRPSIPEIVVCMHQIKVLRFRHVLRLSTPNKGFSRGGEQSRKKAKDEKSTPSARFPADSTAAAHGKCGFCVRRRYRDRGAWRARHLAIRHRQDEIIGFTRVWVQDETPGHSDQNNPIFSEAPASDSSRLGDAVHSASTCPVSGALCPEPGARWCLKGSHHHLLVEKFKVRLKLGEKSGYDSSIFGCWYKRFCRYSATVAD